MFCGVIWRITIGVRVRSDSCENGGKESSSEAEAALAMDHEKFLSACEHGYLDHVKTYLCTKDIDINRGDGDGWPGLSLASYYGRTEVVKLLLLHSIIPLIIYATPKKLNQVVQPKYSIQSFLTFGYFKI